MIVAAKGLTGSKKTLTPPRGLGEKPREPLTIESMIDSPKALAVASIAAATIAGRAVRSETRQVVRQRFTPSAAEPSVHEVGTVSKALTTIATMIGTIMIVRIRMATLRLAPVNCTTYSTERLRPVEIRLCSTHGAIAKIPTSPYTTDGTPASSLIVGSIARLTWAGANSTMNTAAKIDMTMPRITAKPEVRIVAQIKGHALNW